MADLNAQRSFERLEKLAMQTIEKSTPHSVSMVAAKVYLACAIAGMRLDMGRRPITTRSAAVLLREAEEEADSMHFEQSESPHTYYDHCSLAAIFIEAGCPTRAIILQERACDGLARIFGPLDLDVLAYRVYLAELKGPYAVSNEELCEMEQSLQKWYDRMRGQFHLASAGDRAAVIAIDHIGRVKVLSCRKFLISGNGPEHHESESFAIAINDTERILKDALLRMEKLGGVLDPATSQKTKQIYGFLAAMKPLGTAGDFAFERATALLEATSNRALVSVACASIIVDNIEMFVQHNRIRPMCEKILLTLLRNLEAQRARCKIESTSPIMWTTLELLQTTRAQDPGIYPAMQATKLFRHHAICDRCDQVRLLQPHEPQYRHFHETLTVAVHHRHPP